MLLLLLFRLRHCCALLSFSYGVLVVVNLISWKSFPSSFPFATMSAIKDQNTYTAPSSHTSSKSLNLAQKVCS